jgi:hypothetical protein
MRGFHDQHPQADANQSWARATPVLQVVRLHTLSPRGLPKEISELNVVIKWERLKQKPDDCENAYFTYQIDITFRVACINSLIYILIREIKKWRQMRDHIGCQ